MPDPYTSITGDGYRKQSIQEVAVRVPVDIQSTYRPLLDSTVANLAALATYTSASIDVSDIKEVTLVIFADQTTEWKVEQSADGTNWDVVPTVQARTASEKSAIAPIPVVGSKIRWTLKNTHASLATTALRGYLFGRTV